MSESESVRHWVEGAERMLQAAQHSEQSGDYEVVLFSCHLSVEKMLKAYFIATQHTNPPMTHNLVDLCKKMDVQLSDQEYEQLVELSTFSAFARYGDESWINSEATKENSQRWLEISSKFLQKFRP